ncbi:hypothetical protein TTHERM_00101390 (macronuclear) [Tetrahymena thermophila SB210]|uniref:Uncharacterized protein n=1 Tax=Tetrahymena thermophila (strain SB210) TaxID=312017 RepID=Q234R0_TETTS|nr:hypothetical protein TTHERM_00101390 [Tetrahymena thermophila SB210]EAR91943.2 hypothetical protein TTHERM_00101390 [Tetrahymena thermophila SB210]|eukprot:XP_001012188.2 hypothetical protein TTHERM_00101390 [Tetrahymena thermophila SB210]
MERFLGRQEIANMITFLKRLRICKQDFKNQITLQEAQSETAETSYTGGSNAQALKHSSLNESKRSGIASSNAGLLTSQVFFKRKSINNQLSKSQSLSQFRSQNKTQYSGKINSNTTSHFQGKAAAAPARSINDLLHRNNVTLDIQQSMAQMEQITQEVIKQNAFELQSQQEQLQKLQGKFQRQNNELHNSKDRSLDSQNSGQMSQVQTRQYFIQVQQKLQKAQNDFINNIQYRNSQEEKIKSQPDQINNFISFDKLQQQSRQRDNSKMDDSSQISRTIYPSPQTEQKGYQSATKSNFKYSFHVGNTANKQPIEMSQYRKASDNNIFSLTGQQINVNQTRDKLPHQDVLSLCNQNFIDNLNALRKVIRKEQQIDYQRNNQEEIQNQQMNKSIQNQKRDSQKIQGLEGHSINKQNNKVLINKLLADSYQNRKLTYLKSEINDQNQFNQDYKQTDKNYKKLNSLRVENKLDRSHGLENWKGSNYFKNFNNYQKSFTLKNLKGAFDQNSNLNPNGTPKNQQYYLQDTVKQSDHLSNKSRPLKQLINQQNEREQQFNDSQLSNDLEMQLDGSQLLNLQENNILNRKESQMGENDQLNNTNSSFQNVDHSAQSSFYKILKKQNMEILGNNNGGNVQNYDIIDQKFDKIFQTRFHKNLAIRKVDMVYNIKHLAILKYQREKKLLEGSQDPKDLLEYISAKNKIQILLLNAKKISNLEKVAQIIENKINQQNSRINSIVDQLLIKFDINQTQ